MESQFASGETLTCARCFYEWIPRKGTPPARCPQCRSVRWNIPNLDVSCLRCGYSWDSRDGNPTRCPSCGSYKWNVPLEIHVCCKCGYSWFVKNNHVPVRCPKCDSRDWQNADDEVPSDAVEEESDSIKDAIMDAYRNGLGCLEISMSLGVPYSLVREMIEDDGTPIRL